MTEIKKDYDYIILGAGASGLSLLHYLLAEPKTRSKKILLIDQSEKNANDRTWCFWEKEAGAFESLLTKKWSRLYFHSPAFSKLMDIGPYQYKLLRSRDFYHYGHGLIKEHANVTFLLDKVTVMDKDRVNTENGQYKASYIFNSVMYAFDIKPSSSHLLQHFKGWYISTKEEQFNPEKPVMMDFRIPQTDGCSFIYILPLSPTYALIEYTLFSETLLEKDAYDVFLQNYISKEMGIKDFEIKESEFGIIPMSNAKLAKRKGKHIINIGTAGGNSKPSTGYTFRFIQKYCQTIVNNLALDRDPLHGTTSLIPKFKLFDSIFLRVLKDQKIPAWTIFNDLFSKLPPSVVLGFLDEDSHLWSDLRIMNAVNKPAFLKAALKEIIP